MSRGLGDVYKRQCSIWAIGGLQLLAIGVIGEYIGKIYMETKRRPRFIVDKVLDDDEQ